MKKPLPTLKFDNEAEDFVSDVDLPDYDLSALSPVLFEFQAKERRITMRLSELFLS